MPSVKSQTFADKLKLARQTQFVGREKELQFFKQALADNDSLIINIHGQGGVGKSSLLDAFRYSAEESDAYFAYIDCQDLGGSVEMFTSQLGKMLDAHSEINSDGLIDHIHKLAQQRRLVIAIDTFEEAGNLNRWLRQEFLPNLPEICLAVIAGRHPLIDLWQSQPEWRNLIQPLGLDNFDHEMTSHYLTLNGITQQAAIEQAWLSTCGYPLALSLSINLATGNDPSLVTADHSNNDMVTTLTQRWLREIPYESLRPLIEAACVVRIFNQNLLECISEQPVSETDFHQLQNCSFIRKRRTGWALHSMVRIALERELSQRNPEKYLRLSMRALQSLAHAAIKQTPGLDRPLALNEFFYLLGDSLVRAALYEETDNSDKRYIDSADHQDIAALEQYMQDWRMERGVLSNTDINLFDNSRNENIQQHIVSEPREPEFINIAELITLFPGSIRILKDEKSRIKGMTIVLPINGQSIGYLKAQPVTRNYFTELTEQQTTTLSTTVDNTVNWFVRLIDTQDPSDKNSRSALFRDLTSLLIRPARFITTTPLDLYQSLLTRFGFSKLDLPSQYDFGSDRPAPFFELDLRGQRLSQHLGQLIQQQTGGIDMELPLNSLLAAISNPQKQAHQDQSAKKSLSITLSELSVREREVALIAVEGLPNCTIASRLDIGEVTVKKHMGQIFKKLGVRNRSELIKYFWSQTD